MHRTSETNKRSLRLVAALSLLVFIGACQSTPRNLVVLLPEADGKVGEVTVNTADGSTTLKTAGAATGIDSGDAAPGEVFQLEDERIQSIFSGAIEAQPEPPATFVLYFYSDRTRMTEASEAQWSTILAEIHRRSVPDVGIVGHTDRYGPASYNESLSKQRVRVIRRRLENAGVDPAIIDTSWHGENDPIVKTSDGVREPRNRRVEVVVR